MAPRSANTRGSLVATEEGRPARAFSLLEAMVTVAIVGIIASLALPSVLPLRDAARLLGSADLVATTIVRARLEAMAQKRCVRFTLPTPSSFDIEMLNTFDCDVDPASAPRAVAGPLWTSLLGARSRSRRA